MPTYTFRGRDMSEAVEQVRIMLGSDAVIIDTLRGTDHIGRFVEITANGELKAPSPAQQSIPPQPRRPEVSRDGRPMALPRGPATLRGAPSPRPPRMAGQGKEVQIGAPSTRGYDQGDHTARNVRRAHPSPPSRGGMPVPVQQRTNVYQQTPNELPPELALLSDPPKGADRYVHPNSFSTDRGPIIPQSIPNPRQSAGRVDGFSAPPSPRGGMPRQSMRGGPPAPQTLNGRPGHSNEIDPRTGRPYTAREPSSAGGSPHLTPPINRRTVPDYHEEDSLGSYQPSGVDPWGLETQVARPTQQRVATSATSSLGQSVSAVQQMVTQAGGGGEAIQFVTERLNEIVNYIQSSQSSVGQSSPVFEHLRSFQKQLQATGIEERFAEELIEQTKGRIRLNQLDKQVILAHLGQVLAHNLKSVNPLSPPAGAKKNVLAFVGPTGVGKTTTIAKIAAHAQLTHELPVTLISTDTFRMAAVEQLSRYASILDCPAKAAHSPEELWKAIDEADTPLVLVDTTGRNPKTQGQLKALSELFGSGWLGRTVLTVAANTREQDLKPIVEGFSSLKYDMVAVTKLDETYALGTVYNVCKLTGCPISWTTNGQRVPEDIELANAEVLAVKIIMEAISNKV